MAKMAKSSKSMANKDKTKSMSGAATKKTRRYKSKLHERSSRKEEDKGHNIKRKSKKHQVKARSKNANRFKRHGKSSTNTHTSKSHKSSE